jgi:acyl-CoA reductase-like NAD-dependent aldehyde dehydrogenase
LKRVTLELGGNDAAIVLDDADPIDTARKVFQGAMANAGQVCVAIKRAYVPESMYEIFCEELGRLAHAAVVDDGAKQGAQIGPVQNRAQFDKLCALLADCTRDGTIVAGGQAIDRPGFFIAPTIVRDVDDDAAIVREEQFGPVLPVLKYKDLDEVIARANATSFGLGGHRPGRACGAADGERNRLGKPALGAQSHGAISWQQVLGDRRRAGP